MPINPNALSSPDPDPTPDAVAPDGTELGQSGGATASDEPVKKKRRTKKEMVADAVIPGDAELVEVKDVNTGAKVERAWREAVDLVNSGAVEFTDREHGYALKKMQQQEAAPAFADQPAATENIEQPQPSAQGNVPPAAALGDEVRVGAETLRVGHGGVLTSSAVSDAEGNSVKAKRRWQRELGSGVNGPWESVVLTQTSDPKPIFNKSLSDIFPKSDEGQLTTSDTEPITFDKADSSSLHLEGNTFTDKPVDQNGNSSGATVETQKLPRTIEPIEGTDFIKIGTGILERIGLPQVEQFAGGSSLQVGPITMSRTIFDDGRRTEHTFSDGRTGEVITAAAEGFELLDNTCEFIAARFRGQLQSFLEATGVIKQPVS